MIEVEVHGISLDISNEPVLLLREREGKRVLPIWIGPVEATAITYAIRRQPFGRPLTIDVIKRIIEVLGARLERVIITGIKENTYYATLVLSKEGALFSIDARPSDSVAIAVHIQAPIFVDTKLMDAQGKEFTEDEESKLDELKEKLKDTDPEEFGDVRF